MPPRTGRYECRHNLDSHDANQKPGQLGLAERGFRVLRRSLHPYFHGHGNDLQCHGGDFVLLGDFSMSQTKETAKKGSRCPRPARPEDGEEAKRPGISQGKLKKGRAAARKKPEKAGEIRKEGDDGERPIGQATPAAQGSEAANGGSAVVPTKRRCRPGSGRPLRKAKIIPADGNGSSEVAAKGGSGADGTDTDRLETDGGKQETGATEHGGSNIEAAAETEAEAGAVIWDGRAVRSAMEQMARRVTEAGEITRAQQQESWSSRGGWRRWNRGCAGWKSGGGLTGRLRQNAE